MIETLIRAACIADGTGAPGFTADVAVAEGRIVEVGRIRAPARRVIDADGLWLTPGFIDLHTHYDGQASWDTELAPSSWNGVTTLAMGNCGVGFAPVRPELHATLVELLEGVEDIPGTALAEGLTWDWESFPDYLDALARRRFTVDVAAQVPHAALRCYVMGERGADHEARPTADEANAMGALVGEALAAGAMGFSTSRTLVHRTARGAHIGTYGASEDELVAIARAIGKAGRGVVQLISDAYLSPDDELYARETGLIERLAEVSGRPLSFTVQQTDEAPHRPQQLLEEAARWTKAGLDVKGQVAPRAIGVLLGLGATLNPFCFLPSWSALAPLSAAERARRLRAEPELARRLLEEHGRVPPPAGFGQLIARGFQRMFPLADPVDYEPAADDSLAARAGRRGMAPAELALTEMAEGEGHKLFYMPLINYAAGHLDPVHEMLCHPRALYGLSDGGAHCGTICDASFPTTLIGLWPRGIRSGRAITFEEVVAGLTARNADHVGLVDRGRIAPGLRADLNLIEREALALAPPAMVHDLPAGGGRLLQRPRGYRLTMVAGLPTFEDGEATGARPGRLLRFS